MKSSRIVALGAVLVVTGLSAIAQPAAASQCQIAPHGPPNTPQLHVGPVCT